MDKNARLFILGERRRGKDGRRGKGLAQPVRRLRRCVAWHFIGWHLSKTHEDSLAGRG